MTTQKTRRPSILVAIAVLLATTGCANLATIREFASTSADSAQYTALVTRYVESPTAQKRYQPETQHAHLDQMARERAAQRDRLLSLHRAVGDYMDALGQLAADDLAVYDTNLDALGKAVKDGKFAAAGEADAVTAIAKVLTNAVADGWRRRQLGHLIEASNAPFQTVVGALRKEVSLGFRGDLENERLALRNYYRTLERESSDRAGIAALQEWRDQRLAALDARAQALDAYATILAKIGEGHQKLYETRGGLSTDSLLADMHRYANDIKRLFEAVKDLQAR